MRLITSDYSNLFNEVDLLLAICRGCHTVFIKCFEVSVIAGAAGAFFLTSTTRRGVCNACKFDVDGQFLKCTRFMVTACEVPLPHSKPHNWQRAHFKEKRKAVKCHLKNSGSGLSSGPGCCQCCSWVVAITSSVRFSLPN